MKYLRYVALLALLAMPLAYSQAAVIVGGVGEEWASDLAMWGTRRLALTGTIPITHMLAHLTVTTARVGFRAEYSSARAPGITAGWGHGYYGRGYYGRGGYVGRGYVGHGYAARGNAGRGFEGRGRWRAVDSTVAAPAADAKTCIGHLTIGSSGH